MVCWYFLGKTSQILEHLCLFIKFFHCFNYFKNFTHLPGFCLDYILLYDEQKFIGLTETSHRNVLIPVLPVWPGTASVPRWRSALRKVCCSSLGQAQLWDGCCDYGCKVLSYQQVLLRDVFRFKFKCIAWHLCAPLLVGFWDGFNVSPSVVMTDSPCASTTSLYNNKVNLLSANN